MGKPEDKLTLTGETISKDSLGIGAGEVSLGEKIKQIEAMDDEPELPKLGKMQSINFSEIGAGGKFVEIESGESELKPLNEVLPINGQPLTKEKREMLENLKKEDEKKVRSRFNDDAS